MEPIQFAVYQDLTRRNVDEREVRHRLELLFAQRQERRDLLRQRRRQLVQLLRGWRRRQSAAVTLVPGLPE